MVNKKNIAVCILLSLVTCGIYGIIWFVNLTDDVNLASGKESTSGLMCFLLTLVTCGIYGFFWAYRMGQELDEIKVKNGQPSSNYAILFLILQFVGLGIVNYAIIQNELNNM